jgi:hypothetical protein
MDHQGSGRTRSAADTRRQAPWPRRGNPEGAGPAGSAGDYADPEDTANFDRPVFGYGSGAQPVLGPGSGAQPVFGPGSGAQPVLRSGSGAQPVLRSGSGAQPVLGPGTGPQWRAESGGRTPVRGFPPGRAPAEPPPDVYSPWHTPGEPLTGTDGTDGGDGAYGDDTDRFARIEPERVPAGRRRSAKEKPKRRLLSRSALLATTTVVVVAAAGYAGYKFLYEPRVNAPVSSSLRLPTTAPQSSGAGQAHGNKWQHITASTGDPAPLTIDQLYPPQFVLGSSSYLRTAASITKNCSSAVYGANLQAALQSGHCTQVVRASYISGNGKMMGTVGVVNLSTVAAAQKAGQATGPQEIIVPLAAKKGATSKLGSGTGVVQAEIKGHYLILMWAEFADLKSPPTAAARQLLEQFATNLVTGTANIDLSTRLLSGKP